jgi:hypothetical protein
MDTAPSEPYYKDEDLINDYLEEDFDVPQVDYDKAYMLEVEGMFKTAPSTIPSPLSLPAPSPPSPIPHQISTISRQLLLARGSCPLSTMHDRRTVPNIVNPAYRRAVKSSDLNAAEAISFEYHCTILHSTETPVVRYKTPHSKTFSVLPTTVSPQNPTVLFTPSPTIHHNMALVSQSQNDSATTSLPFLPTTPSGQWWPWL